jgi:hypothetical protein
LKGSGSHFGSIAACALTFVAVVVGWVFFRAQNLDAAVAMLAGMSGMNGASLPVALANYAGGLRPLLEKLGIGFSLAGGTQFVLNYLWIIALFAIAFFLPNTQQFLARHDPTLVAGAAPGTSGPHRSRRDPDAGGMLHWRPTRAWALLVGIIFAGGILTLTHVSEFLYFQF